MFNEFAKKAFSEGLNGSVALMSSEGTLRKEFSTDTFSTVSSSLGNIEEPTNSAKDVLLPDDILLNAVKRM